MGARPLTHVGPIPCRMRNTTVNLSEFQIQLCEAAVQAGLAPSRSEIMRAALNEWFDKKRIPINLTTEENQEGAVQYNLAEMIYNDHTVL